MPGDPSSLRVLLVTKGLDLGGLERVVTDLAVGLQRRGVSMTVAVVSDRRDRLVPKLDASGVTVIRLGGSDRIGLRAGLRLRSVSRSAAFDVVHVHSPLPTPLVRSSRGARHRVIATLHTPWTALHPGTRLAWRLTARRDRSTIAVSGAVAASLPRRIGERTMVIPHGVDAAAIAAAGGSRRETRTELGVTDDDILVVTVASHRDVKNYPNLLRAFKSVLDAGRGARLIAVGEGERLINSRRLADELGIAHACTFLAVRDDVLSMIAAADVVAVASDFEGQPLVVVEALALGRPVVATSVGRVPELVPPAVGRVVPPGDAAALGRALIELIDDRELRAAMSATAVERSGAWTLDDVLDAHLALYRQVASRD